MKDSALVTLTLGQISRIVCEALDRAVAIGEDKTSLIKNRLALPDIEDETEREAFKSTLIDFFKKHPNYENKIDWNKAKTLTRKDFQQVLNLELTSKKAQKKEIQSDVKNIFKSVGDRKFAIVGENSKWLFVAPLTYEAAKYCDSSENQGAGAKWCIGYEKDDIYWYRYIREGSLFIMAFNKNYRSISPRSIQINLKYMIQRDDIGDYHIWNQKDTDTGSDLKKIKSEKAVLEEMFGKVKVEIDREIESLEQETNEKVLEILRNCGETIEEKTIPKKYKIHLDKIEIPRSVTRIGYAAFQFCNNLTSVTIPDSVTRIGNEAFSGCRRLASITIPDSVTRIGYEVFTDCKSLKSITIPSSVTSIGEYAFSLCTSLTSVTIPNSVTSIENCLFGSCWKLTSITIPDSVTRIGEQAFIDCRSLKTVTIPDSVTSIGNFAFWKCLGLESMTIPSRFKGEEKRLGIPETAKVEYR